MTAVDEFSLEGKKVFLTGGTGSFGTAFVRHLMDQTKTCEVTIYSRDEMKQFELAGEIRNDRVSFVIGDVRDKERLQRAMVGADVVVHAAALKQIPASEANPIECIRTNILGAENIINCAIDNGVSRVVALSTDKACNPINLYGATKLCSDKLFIAANQLQTGGGPRFSIVRYGNVIGSRGSVIPFFKKMAQTGELPITDPEMTRFWITLDQGVQKVMRSLAIMKGGEILVPKLPSMRVVDLASAIGPDCKQKVIGIRPGERIHEVMVPRDEARNTLEFSDFYIILPSFHWAKEYRTNEYNGETGKPVPDDFEYISNINDNWMTAEALRKIVD